MPKVPSFRPCAMSGMLPPDLTPVSNASRVYCAVNLSRSGLSTNTGWPVVKASPAVLPCRGIRVPGGEVWQRFQVLEHVSAQYPGIRIVQGYPAHVVRHNAFEAVGYAV